MGSSDDDDGEADENYGNDITDDENDDDDEDDSNDDEFADFIASQEATKYDNYNDYDNNTDIHKTNNDDDEEEEDNEDEDEEEDIVMQLEFATMSTEKEQLLTEIIKEEEEKMKSKNSSDTNNTTTTNRVTSRRRSSVAFSTTDVNSTVDDDGNNSNHNDTSTPDSDQQRRQRRSSVISLRPSIMSKETAEKVFALLSKETDDNTLSESKSVIMEEKNSTISNTNNNEKDKHENNEEQQEQQQKQQELDWEELSLEKKLNKIKCAAAGGGLVLLGIITTPTPLPTLPLIVAGFHILGKEYEQAKEVEDQLMEKVDAAKTTVMQKYEEYTTTNGEDDQDDQEDADKGAEVDGIITKEEVKQEDVDTENEKEDTDTTKEDDDEKEEDEEFSDFIVSQWKDHVEIGLRIQYPLPCTKYLVVNHTTNDDHDTHDVDVNNTNTNIDTDVDVELEGVLLDNKTEAAATTKSEIEVRTNKHVYEVVLHKKIAAIAQLESEKSTTKHQDVDDDDSSVQCENGDTLLADPPHQELNNDVTRHRLPVLQLSTRLEEQSMAPLFDGTQWAGTRIWKAAVLGLEYIIRLRRREQQKQQQNPNTDITTTTTTTPNLYSSLLELGCGLGVPGMIWKQLLLHEHESNNNDSTNNKNQPMISPRVVLTDRDSLLLQLQTNLENNFGTSSSDELGEEGLCEEEGSATQYKNGNHQNIVAKTLEWSTAGIQALLQDEQQQQQQQQQRTPDQCQEKKTTTSSPLFDICLNCDCIYEPLYGRAAWEALADVLIALAIQSPTTLLVTSVERRNSDNVEGFLQKLTTSGVMEVPIECVVHDDSDPYHIIEIYTTKGISSSSSSSSNVT